MEVLLNVHANQLLEDKSKKKKTKKFHLGGPPIPFFSRSEAEMGQVHDMYSWSQNWTQLPDCDLGPCLGPGTNEGSIIKVLRSIGSSVVA